MDITSKNLNWNIHTLHFSLALGSIGSTGDAFIFNALDNLKIYTGSDQVYLFKAIDQLTGEIVASTAKDKTGLVLPASLYEHAILKNEPVFQSFVNEKNADYDIFKGIKSVCFLPFSILHFNGCIVISWQEIFELSAEFELFIQIAHVRLKELLNYSGVVSELNETKMRLGMTMNDLASANDNLAALNQKLSGSLRKSIVATKELQASIEELQSRSEELDALNVMLKSENELMYSVFNQSRDALFLARSIGSEILDCNDTALDFFDTDNKKNIIGRSCSSFFYDNVSNTEILKILNNPTKSFKYRLKTFSDGMFWGNISCKLVYRENKAFRLIIISDITPCINEETKSSHVLQELN